MLSDALGRPLRFLVTPGQTGDITAAPALLEGQVGRAVVADKAYDSNALRAMIAETGTEAVIPSNRSREIAIPHDAAIYRLKNRIERCFNRLKHFRHPLRPPDDPLLRLHPSRRSLDLVEMNVDPS